MPKTTFSLAHSKLFAAQVAHSISSFIDVITIAVVALVLGVMR
jgi:hypothetical protein